MSHARLLCLQQAKVASILETWIKYKYLAFAKATVRPNTAPTLQLLLILFKQTFPLNK